MGRGITQLNQVWHKEEATNYNAMENLEDILNKKREAESKIEDILVELKNKIPKELYMGDVRIIMGHGKAYRVIIDLKL